MSVELVRYLAMILTPSITAAARPAVTFAAIQILVAVLVQQGFAAVPAGLEWLISTPAIVVGAVFAALETASRHDPDIAALLRDLHIDHLTGAFGAFSAALLFTSLGLPREEAAVLVPDDSTGELLEATGRAIVSERPLGLQIGAVGGAVALNAGLVWLRAQFLEFLHDFALGKAWARFETGGVLTILILLPFLPVFAAGVMLFFAAGLGALALAARAARSWADQRARVACEHCGYRLRPEASVCPECKTARSPTVELGQETGFGAAWSALRREKN